jgi:acetyltransferase
MQAVKQMSTRNLDKVFRPQSIAVIGASNKPDSVGYTVLQNILSCGFAGKVHPVNPKHSTLLECQRRRNH